MPREPSAIRWITASLAKAGNRESDNEDAAAADGKRFAVADGATEGWESRAWANQLASAYVARPFAPDGFAAWLARVQRTWKQPAKSAQASWYATEKRTEGSFATFLGIEMRRTAAEWRWRAAAIGDSCLLHVRDERVEESFPMTLPTEFGNRPTLVPSSASSASPEPACLAGRALPGDLLLLATDAVAAGLLGLSAPTAWRPVLEAIHESLRAGNPGALVERLRVMQSAANDDMTLSAVYLPRPTEAP